MEQALLVNSKAQPMSGLTQRVPVVGFTWKTRPQPLTLLLQEVPLKMPTQRLLPSQAKAPAELIDESVLRRTPEVVVRKISFVEVNPGCEYQRFCPLKATPM